MKKIVVVGSGLAGMIAAGSFRGNHLLSVYEMGKQSVAGLSGHNAVLRFRDPKVGLLIGCDFEEITAYKAVLFFGQLYEHATMTMNNLYSRKLYDKVEERSLLQLGAVKRYIALDKKVVLADVNYSHELIGIEKGALCFKAGKKEVLIPYDFCIATLPLPYLLKLCGKKADFFQFQSIYVRRLRLEKSLSKVHQTIYVPELKYKTYRVTLENSTVIFESIGELSPNFEVEELLSYFGLSSSDIDEKKMESYEHKMGKINEIDDDLRRFLLLSLTEEYNIFLFGRYAIWKPIRADSLISDVEKIKKMINFSDVRRRYESYLS